MPPPLDFFATREWAIRPDALDGLLRGLSTLPESLAPRASSLLPAADDVARPAGLYALRDGVAVVTIDGPIMRQAFVWGGEVFWDGQDRIRSALSAVQQDSAARAIVLAINSPGGPVAGTKELRDHIAILATHKPIYVYADGECASAAYWLATGCRAIYAPITAMIGSIGVVISHCDQSAADAERGYSYTYIASGTWKTAGNPHQPLSDEDQAYLRGIVCATNDIFRADVISGRPVAAEQPLAWGDGQIFLADQAKSLGLINGVVAGLDALISLIQEEITMNKEQLAAAHPELLAQIQAEARQEAEALAQQKLAGQQESILAIVGAVVGAEAAGKIGAILAAGVTALQLEALLPLLQPAAAAAPAAPAVPAQPAASAASAPLGAPPEQAPLAPAPTTRQTILAQLRTVTPAPVDTTQLPAAPDPINAAIDRIGGIAA